MLAVLYAETTAALDTKTDDPADVLGNRVRALQDVLYVLLTLPTDDPAVLRLQARTIREFATGLMHEQQEVACMMLAATYAERLAEIREGAR